MSNENKSIHEFDFSLICEYFSSENVRDREVLKQQSRLLALLRAYG